MAKRLAYHFMVLILMLSFSLFLNACAKKAVTGEKLIEQNEEISMADDKTSLKEEEELRLKAEQEKAEREARLKEEALRIQREREEASRREAAAREEARLREEFENKDIHFDFDRSFLPDEARMILARKSTWLLDHPDVRIEIEGHCDERGTNEYNMALGEKRASSALNYLVTTGVKADAISTISFGEEGPVEPGHDEEAWARNRRAHFRIVSD